MKRKGYNKRMCFIILIVLIISIIILFNKYAYEIDQFNSKIRNCIVKGEFNLRVFDDKGIPYSISPNKRNKFVSPFYVVHYGLLYSGIYKKDKNYKGIHWRFDSSLDLWNEPPKSIKREYFIYAANWLVDHIAKFDGCYHIIYNFDWKYKNYPNGKLNSPWYSGLTDGYSIILFLRAYDVTKDEKYLECAQKMYEACITPISNNGNLNLLDGLPWIEEYIDPKVKDYHRLPFVLNGMIYATYGVIAYENYMEIINGYSKALIRSIIYNLNKFVNKRWSFYDLVGTSANLKYHRIHVGLLKELYDYIKDIPEFSEDIRDIETVMNIWKKSLNNIGINYILYGEKTVTYYHFLVSFILTVIIIFLIWFYICRKFI